MSIFVQAVSVYSSTNVDLDARTNNLGERSAYNARIGNFALDKASAVEAKLSTNFKSNTIDRSLVVPNSLARSLQVRVDTVIIGGSVLRHVVGGMHSNGILTGRVADSTMISTDLPYIHHV